MARYTPPRVSQTFERIRGQAKVQLHKKTGDAKILFREPKKEYLIKSEFVQADPVWPGMGMVEVSEDGRYFFAMRPWKGLFKARCTGIVAKEGEEPVPNVKSGNWGPYSTFTALFEILEGKYQGAVYAMNLSYKFVDAEGVAALPGERGKSQYTDKAEDFMYAVGAWDTAIDYSDNILPEIDRRIKNAERGLMIAVKEGWIDQLIDVDEEDPDQGEDWD
jgi:hypothetical protein